MMVFSDSHSEGDGGDGDGHHCHCQGDGDDGVYVLGKRMTPPTKSIAVATSSLTL